MQFALVGAVTYSRLWVDSGNGFPMYAQVFSTILRMLLGSIWKPSTPSSCSELNSSNSGSFCWVAGVASASGGGTSVADASIVGVLFGTTGAAGAAEGGLEATLRDSPVFEFEQAQVIAIKAADSLVLAENNTVNRHLPVGLQTRS